MVKPQIWASTFHALNLTYGVKRDDLPKALAFLASRGISAKPCGYWAEFDDVQIQFLLPVEPDWEAPSRETDKQMKAIGCTLRGCYPTTRVCPPLPNELEPKCAQDFRVWRSVESGPRFETIVDYHRVLNQCNIELDQLVLALFRESAELAEACKYGGKDLKFDLVRLSVGELGAFPSDSLAFIYNSAKQAGLMLCPPVVGPLLRIHYRDKFHKTVLIAMEPIKLPEGSFTFSLSCRTESLSTSSVFQLGAISVNRHTYNFSPDMVFIFLRPKS